MTNKCILKIKNAHLISVCVLELLKINFYLAEYAYNEFLPSQFRSSSLVTVIVSEGLFDSLRITLSPSTSQPYRHDYQESGHHQA